MEVSSHSLFLLQQLNVQREFGFLCDCTVAIGNVYFKAHRAVLAAFSNYFKMIFIHQSRSGELRAAFEFQFKVCKVKLSRKNPFPGFLFVHWFLCGEHVHFLFEFHFCRGSDMSVNLTGSSRNADGPKDILSS